jgi:DNA-binding TFAR19-related protein (PDSD5 family)
MQGEHLAVSACTVQLVAIRALLDFDKLDALSAGAEPTFITLASFFGKVYGVVAAFVRELDAEDAVAPTHRAFLEKMLARHSFNAMLTLVRETNSLLKRARLWQQQQHQLGEPDGEAKLQPMLEWVREHRVVEELLNVNMHQRQYVESVQQLLTTLAEIGALDKDVLVNLWGKLRQVC